MFLAHASGIPIHAMKSLFDRRRSIAALVLRVALAAVCASAVFAPLPVMAQDRDWTAPTPPPGPRTRAECKAFDNEWAAIRKKVNKQHSDCLDGATSSDRGSRTCSYAKCEPYHDAGSLGRAQVDRCYDQVRRFEEAGRKAEEARRAEAARIAQEQAESDRRRQEVIRAQQAAVEAEAQQLRAQAEAQAAAARAETERQAQAAREALEDMNRRLHAQQEANERAAERTREAFEQYEARSDERAQERDDAEARVRDADTALQNGEPARERTLAELRDQFARNVPPANPFDRDARGTAAADEFVESAAESNSDTEDDIETLGAVMETAVPFASVPLVPMKNSSIGSLRLLDRIVRYLEGSDVSEEEIRELFDTFGQRMFSPSDILKKIAANAGGEFISNRLLEPAADLLRNKIAPAVSDFHRRFDQVLETADIRAALRTPPPLREGRAIIRNWWTSGPTAAGRQVRRNADNIPVLVSPGGSVYSPRSHGEAERLVANGDYTVAYDRTYEWKEHTTVLFIPPEEAVEPRWLDWAPGVAVTEAWDRFVDAADPHVPQRLKNWLAERRQQ